MDWRGDMVVALAMLCLFQWDLGLAMGIPPDQPVVVPISLDECEDNLEMLDDIPYSREHCGETCIASGDPHINTFDCVKYEYHGKCSYTLVKNCDSGLTDFEIIGEFHRMKYHAHKSVIKSLKIIFQGTVIHLDSNFNVFVDEESVSEATYELSFGFIERYCNGVVVYLSNGVSIYWVRPYKAVIKIDQESDAMLTGKLCGLCGNNNDVKYDDFTTPDSELVSDAVALGDSWRTDSECGMCEDCTQTICQNNRENYQQAQDLCAIFLDESMPSCGDTAAQTLYENCVNILCATLPEIDRLCQLINIYIETCVEGGVEVKLHLNNVCQNGCHRNGVFIEYGTSWTDPECTEKCSCDSVAGINCTNIQCHEHATCIERPDGNSTCVCNEPDYIGDGLECSGDPCEPNPCLNGGMCVEDDMYTFICECVDGYSGIRCDNPPPCESNPCQNGGTCIAEDDGAFKCICPFGIWSGETCTVPCQICWACGDPHYTTFDGRKYNFQGKCMYTLAKSTSDAQYQFEVVGNNVPAYWNTKVSYTREIYVMLDFGGDGWWSFGFRYGYSGIQVNYESVNIPYTNTDAEGNVRVHIVQAGYYTFLSTNFGLYVGWNGKHCAFIIVPDSFVNQVEGLCGLFNFNKKDDFRRPDGVKATSRIEFGNSWVHEEIETCQEVCTPETCDDGNPCVENMDKEPMADVLCGFLQTEINLVGKPTEQSSVYENMGSSIKAVDGNMNGDYLEGSCIRTNKQREAWWYVDLGEPRCIGKIVIYNTNDNGKRLSDAIVRVGNDINTDNNPQFGTVIEDMITQSVDDETNELELLALNGGLLGRYISVHLPGNQYLQLCEVKAYVGTCEEEINLIGSSTQQSSTYDNIISPSANAVDGNPDGNYYSKSCIVTTEEDKPYWSVEMDNDYCIGNVEIFKREDCCDRSLLGAVVRIGSDSDVKNNPKCGTITEEMIEESISLESPLTVSCNLKGNYISVHLPCYGVLQMCEVKAYPGKCGGGPFAPCFDVIDPATYLDNCKYDICSGSPAEAICDDLAQYATDCVAAGVEVPGDWRNMVPSCAIECAENEEYLPCGPACPATCSNPENPEFCYENCVEGCFCKEGLLWTPDGCVPAEECGCTHNGKYYLPNSEFITEDCSKKCTCHTGGEIVCDAHGPCDENAECSIRNGQRDCYCNHGYVGEGLECAGWHQCRAYGEPHYETFDGRKYSFMGKCKYTLVKCESSDIDFDVIVHNIAYKYDTLYSLTRQVTITAYDLKITIGPKSRIRVNGEKISLPYDYDGRVTITSQYKTTIVQTDFGLEVQWDGIMAATVRLLDSFMNQCVGLCGAFNGDSLDDLQGPESKLIHNVNDFGHSWKYGSDEYEACDCTDDSCPDVDPCDAKVDVSDLCYPIQDIFGPFSACFDEVDPQPFFEKCSFDSCAAQNSTEILCDYFANYVAKCREVSNGEVSITGWRNNYPQCAIDCGERARYTDCANPCQPTCVDPTAQNNPTCGNRACFQGCECLSGLVLSGDECIAPNQCGCQLGGRYYQATEEFISSDCSQRCVCVGRDLVECQTLGCGDNAVCDVRDDVRGCYCPDGFELLSDGKTCKDTTPCAPNPCLNGGQCVETDDSSSYVCLCPFGQWAGPTCDERIHKCYALGDPHYITFDGKIYSFQGKCSYTLAKSLPGAPHEFEVVGKNAGFRGGSVTKKVDIYLKHRSIDYKISLSFRKRRILVNEVAYNLPYYVRNNDGTAHISVEEMGSNIVLKSDFGLMVEYNRWYTVKIYLSESYLTFAGGLCGYFNDDSIDDFTDPEYNLVSQVINFGNSWVYGECSIECTPDTCPVDPCEGNTEGAMAADMLCEPLEPSNSFSVFAKCFATVTPTALLNFCKYDMCLSSESDILCEYYNTYATECGDAGVNVGNWRASFPSCEFVCGDDENMVYHSCGSACEATCANLDATICNSACVEGCQCKEGYVRDVDRCVKPEECGCSKNGAYYHVGETYMSEDCMSECVCVGGGTINCTPPKNLCNENQVCEIQNGIQGCYCPVGFFQGADGVCQEYHTCSACGDPHFKTFDGKKYNYQGKCSYILVQTGPDAPYQFLVVGDNLPFRRYPRASATRYVHISVYGKDVKFSWDTSDVLVNHEIVQLPYTFGDDKIFIYSVGQNKVLLTNFGLRIVWDGKFCVTISVPDNFVTHSDGLCGYLSNDKSDDFRNPQGELEKNKNSFGDSWLYGEECEPSGPDEDPCDNQDNAAVANDVCSPLTDLPGPLSDCPQYVDASELGVLDDCMFDICADPKEIELACTYLEQYASACQAEGVNVNGWRQHVPQCEMVCGQFMQYSDCASGCPATCADQNASENYCTLGCTQACECIPGFVLSASGDSCIPVEECGCTWNGKSYSIGDQFVDETCDSECICEKDNTTKCIRISCADRPNAVCEVQSGVRGCYCEGSYIRSGDTCITPCEQSPNPCRNGGQCVNDDNVANGYFCQCPDDFVGSRCEISLISCSASGDPHYVDFDGKRFNFQGDCEYILSQNCSSNVPEFKIIVDNQKPNLKRKVSRTRTVTVVLNDQTIVLGQQGSVMVNNGPETLPVHGSKYSVNRLGISVVLRTDFNLVVQWSGFDRVIVRVPSGFGGNLCGLCGNGNGEGRMTSAGLPESNKKLWAHSWATNQDQCDVCEDCPTDEDICETVSPTIKENAYKHCEIINATEGHYHIMPNASSVAKRSIIENQSKRIVRRSSGKKTSLMSKPILGDVIARDQAVSKRRSKRAIFDENCNKPLNILNDDATISSSGSYDKNYGPEECSLNNDKYWAAKGANKKQWIQVCFRDTVTINGIRTQGSASPYREWVNKLKVQFGDNDESLTYIMDGDKEKEFTANTDHVSTVDIPFPESVHAKCLRIKPTKWNEWIGLRFEIIGCTSSFDVNCMAPLGIESKNVHDTQITSSSDWKEKYNLVAEEARLKNSLYWAPEEENPEHSWLQFDFLEKRTMTGIYTQGSALSEYDEWVTVLKIQCGETEDTMTYIKDGDKPKEFRANIDRTSVASIIFPKQIECRILRIEPVYWHTWIALRVEVIGCPIHYAIFLQGKQTDQSSNYDDFRSPSGNAVDGSTSGNYNQESCAVTKSSGEPWWSVDLDEPQCVGKVVLYNRVDCCGERLKGAEVRIGSDPNLKNNAICGVVTSENDPKIEMTCALYGKYISVHLPRSDFLQLCEVEAFTGECLTEIPLQGKETQQSSTEDDMKSQSFKAVDGILNTVYSDGSCARTLQESQPWWWVDMGTAECVGSVVIYNTAGDGRLEGAIIRVGSHDGNDKTNNAECGTVTSSMIADSDRIEVLCDLRGRYISIQLPGHGSVQLCEVKAFTGRCGGVCNAEDGSIVPEGRSGVDSSNPCLFYECLDGELLYSEFMCPAVLPAKPDHICHEITSPGECCPYMLCVPSDCRDPEGNLIPNGSTVGDACTSCTCTDGELACLSYSCALMMPPDDKSCKEVTPFGECCPHWECEEKICLGESEQSSIFADITASNKATDGNEDGDYYAASCAVTNGDKEAWWSVNMCETECVGKVVVYNRADCCKERLAGAIVRVGFNSEKERNPVCGIITNEMIEMSQKIEVSCNEHLVGKYVSIHLPGENYLQLCEVEVYTGTCIGKGPFVNCHGVIDPAPYFSDCTYDWCATSSKEQLCADIAAYAADCQMQGIDIGDWRDEVYGCSYDCPNNAHYKVCPAARQTTCADLTAEYQPCQEYCREGCVCDDGFILDGDLCIPVSNCEQPEL